MNGNNEEPVTIDADSKDEKKLSKGQLKKLKEKEKAKKQGAETEAEAEPEAPATSNVQAEEANKEEKAEDEEDVGAGEGTKGLSKGQLKKLKEKAKKEAKGPAEEKKEEEDKGDKKKGGKKPTAVAELARKRLEEQKKLDEEIKRLEAEAKAKEDEENRKQEEEERIQREIEEEKRRKKQEKKDQLKKEGKYMTKAQKDAAKALEERRKELIAQGIITETQEEEGETGKPKSIAVRTRKPKGKKETTRQEEAKETEGQDENKEVQEKKVEDFANWEEEYADTSVVRPKAETDKPDEDSWENFDANDTKKTEETTKPKDKAPKVEKKETPKVESKPLKAEEKPKGAEKVETQTMAAPEVEKKKKEAEESKAGGPNEKIRSPIICILGHVDTGKTKLLDNMRSTNVQEGEAGGITQQIGATFFPYEKLNKEITKTHAHYPVDIQVPGLLIIDTPGHESFSNLRSRGSGLCDIAILVVDIMHGLEKQTLESIELLKFRKTPFVIALNKIDRIYGWKPKNDTSSYVSLKKQEKHCQLEFRDRSKGIMTELTEKGFNVALYYDNPDPNNYVSIVPTSAMTGEGISDLLSVAVNLTQKWLKKKITKKDEFKCTVLEVKVIEGLGASIDIMLVDGTIHEGDRIVLAGYDGPIVTSVRALLTPHPMREMRVKNEYIHHKQISGAMGIKVSANDLEKALAGSELYIAKTEEDEEIYKKLVEEEIAKVKKSIKLVEEGVLVAASTLGSLEALLQFLKTSNIPVSTISIGPVSKAEIIKAMKPLQVTEGEIKKEYATILAFDVKILQDAKELAEHEGVKIFTANIIYHLFDHFTAYLQELREERKRNEGKLAVFPVVLKPVAFFNMKDPIVMGIDVVEGQLRLNTPLCVVEKGKLRIGTVESMEKEHKPLQVVRPSDGSVAIKLRGDSTILAGRHFELKDRLVSVISRESIDALKKYFRDEMSKADWELVKKLKTAFGII